MNLGELLHKGVSVALDTPILQLVSEGAAGTAYRTLHQHFTLTGSDLADALGDSFARGLSAIDDELNGGRIARALGARLQREYRGRVRTEFLEPFVAEHGLDEATRELLCRTLHEHCTRLLPAREQLFPPGAFPEPEIAELLTTDVDGVSGLLVARIEQLQGPLPVELRAFLGYRDLLGDAVLFFFRELLRRDSRVEATLGALQQAGLRGDVRRLDDRLAELQDQQSRLQSTLSEAIRSGDRAYRDELTARIDRLDDLLVGARAHQSRLERFRTRFDDWTAYLDLRLDQLQDAVISEIREVGDEVRDGFDSLHRRFDDLLQNLDTGVPNETRRPVSGESAGETAAAEPPAIGQPSGKTALPLPRSDETPPVTDHNTAPSAAPRRAAYRTSLLVLVLVGLGGGGVWLVAGEWLDRPVAGSGRGDVSVPDMVFIEGGRFTMGSPVDEHGRDAERERPQRVTVDDFHLGRYAVTFAEYDRFARATGREPPDDRGWGRGERPVINVSWHDARSYAEWLSERTGRAYRLPTEAEWEYAARAGTTTPFSTGDCIHTDQANYNGRQDYADCGAATGVYRQRTVPVGSLPANPWGLYEVHGNVWEWTCSAFDADAGGAGQRCAAPDDEAPRAVRGGSWASAPVDLRSALRTPRAVDYRFHYLGFRLARSMPERSGRNPWFTVFWRE